MPAPLQMDNAFAYDTMAVRIPGIVRDIQATNPDYPPAIMRALDRLHDALVHDQSISTNELLVAPDYDDWQAAHQAQRAHDLLARYLRAAYHDHSAHISTSLYLSVLRAIRR